MTVTSANGCTTNHDGDWPVRPPPRQSFTSTPSATAASCFTTPTTATTYAWIRPDGTVAPRRPRPQAPRRSHRPTPHYLPGDWQLRITDADGCDATSPARALSSSPYRSPRPAATGRCVLAKASPSRSMPLPGPPTPGTRRPALRLLSQNQTLTINSLAAGTHARFVTISLDGCTSGRATTTATVNALPTSAPRQPTRWPLDARQGISSHRRRLGWWLTPTSGPARTASPATSPTQRSPPRRPPTTGVTRWC